MSDNIILAFPNRTDNATLTGGSWTSALPLDNLKNRLLSKVARSTNTSLSSTQFTVNFAQPYPVRVIGLVNHNLSFNAKWRVRGFDTDSPPSLIYDSGWTYVWLLTGTLWSVDLVEWEADNFWYGGYAAEEVEGFTISAFHVAPDVEKTAAVWKVELDDPDNVEGFVDIGRLFIGPGWQPDINYSYGAALGYESGTSVEASLGSVEFFEDQEPTRTFDFTFDTLSEEQGYTRALEIMRQADVSREVVVIPKPSDETQALRRNFMGRLRELGSLGQPYFETMSIAFRVKEIR